MRSGSSSADGLQRALEVVDDRQQLGDHLAGRVFGQIAPLAVHALAVVVELGGRAQQAILQAVPLSTELLERIGLGLVLLLLRILIVERFGHGHYGASRRTRDTACVVPSTSEIARE